MGKQIHQNIKEWVIRISTPKDTLGGLPICPYAKNSKYIIIESDGDNLDSPQMIFEIIIYVLPDHYTIENLDDIVKKYNRLYPDYVFLPDHKDRNTFISNEQTNNSNQNLILCQPRNELLEARSKLKNTDYYSYWSKEYLNEILNT